MAWTYILECADGSFYVGSTVDLERRISEHDVGLGAAYTAPRRRRPVRLVWAAEFVRIDDAFAYEKRVQGWSRAKRIALIEGRMDELPALASRAWRYRRPVGSPGFETVAAQLLNHRRTVVEEARSACLETPAAGAPSWCAAMSGSGGFLAHRVSRRLLRNLLNQRVGPGEVDAPAPIGCAHG